MQWVATFIYLQNICSIGTWRCKQKYNVVIVGIICPKNTKFWLNHFLEMIFFIKKSICFFFFVVSQISKFMQKSLCFFRCWCSGGRGTCNGWTEAIGKAVTSKFSLSACRGYWGRSGWPWSSRPRRSRCCTRIIFRVVKKDVTEKLNYFLD